MLPPAPEFGVNNDVKVMEIKKAWGVSTSAHP